ncbi:MAG: iron complex transport system ATP-binding protein [Cyclobacteriaceae bacterium]|jgi:iron complex transport system ATP-binding protein
MSLFNTKDLTIGYRQKSGNKILQKNLALTINSGEIVSLMGQNGVGKTTFIKTISGLLEPLSGDVFYNGTSLQKISNQDLSKKLSLVLTEKPFSFNMSVLELVALGRHPYSNWIGILSNEDKEVIEWAITETNTNYLADQKLYQLSDGQLQKVMIARALAQQTDLIFLDEPAAHLDLHNKIEVMMLLRKIAKQGKSILISTHDMQISTQLSDKLWLFNFNEPTRIGAPEDLILDGSLEQTLYLKDYGYDMIHGVVNIPQTGLEISVIGPEKEKFWTEQALKRNEFQVKNGASLSIVIRQGKFLLNDEEFDTITSLLEALKNT